MNQSDTNDFAVVIIGAGVVGSAIARELSRFQLTTAVLERNPDAGMETSCRNSGVLHAGFNYTPGSLRARLAVRGNAMMDRICNDLKVRIKRIGKLTVAFNEAEDRILHNLKNQGDANSVPNLEIIGRERMEAIQPGVGGISALYSPTSSIISPYGLNIALAENAAENGVKFFTGHEVTSIRQNKNAGWIIDTSGNTSFGCKVLINAAGLRSAETAEMAGATGYRIYPCRGEYYVLDKRLAGSLNCLVYHAPDPKSPGLGIHLTPTVDGNILIGPSADYIEKPEDYACTRSVMEQLRHEGRLLLPEIRVTDFIRSFAGNRPKQTPPETGGNKDFVIEDRKDLRGFINLVGIESPGLTSSPAIAEMVRDFVAGHLDLKEKSDFMPVRPGSSLRFSELPDDDKTELLTAKPDHGEIICRCEKVTRREIIEAAANSLQAKTLNGIKLRSRAMMGRCQGGFCLPKITRLLIEEFGLRPEDILLGSEGSAMFTGNMRKKPEES